MPTHHLLHHWDEVAIDRWERAAPLPDDDPYARIALISPSLAVNEAIELIPSWAADTPSDGWIEVQLRVQQSGRWSKWYRMAVWGDDGSHRTSFESQ